VELMGSPLVDGLKPRVERKVITEVRWHEAIPYDQDRKVLPLALARAIRESQNWEEEEILKEWNELPDRLALAKHPATCLFSPLRPDVWACRCVQTIFFDASLRYACICCQEPRVEEHSGLCEMCQTHEYAPSELTEQDHEDRYLDELATSGKYAT
jgi:hypothetical protein